MNNLEQKIILDSREYQSNGRNIKFELVQYICREPNFYRYYAIEWQYNCKGRKYQRIYEFYKDVVPAFNRQILATLTK